MNDNRDEKNSLTLIWFKIHSIRSFRCTYVVWVLGLCWPQWARQWRDRFGEFFDYIIYYYYYLVCDGWWIFVFIFMVCFCSIIINIQLGPIRDNGQSECKHNNGIFERNPNDIGHYYLFTQKDNETTSTISNRALI